MREVTLYEAFDGERFPAAAECRAYESAHLAQRLAGLTAEQIEAALTCADIELAHAIEDAGARIARARREAGDLRLPRRKEAEVDQPTAAQKFNANLAADVGLSAHDRGIHAFRASMGGIVPDDLRDDPVASEAWLAAWDAESVKAKADDPRPRFMREKDGEVA